MTPATTIRTRSLRRRLGATVLATTALAGSAGLLAACGGSGTSGAAVTTTVATDAPADTGSSATTADGPVLPVDADPITNTATTQAFAIDSVLVENNEDANGNAVDDHLEITVTNTSTQDLGGFEVFYTFDDTTDGVSESYYAALPADFTIGAGATRVIHFDPTGAPDHFPVNAYSLYYTDTNALDVSVEVSATGAAPQTATVQKDAGGAEVPD